MKTMGLCGCEASADSRKCNSRRIRKVCIFPGPVECLQAKRKDPSTPWKEAKKTTQTSSLSSFSSHHSTRTATGLYRCGRCGKRYQEKPMWGDCPSCDGAMTVSYAP